MIFGNIQNMRLSQKSFDDYVIAGLTRNPLIISNIFSWDPSSGAG